MEAAESNTINNLTAAKPTEKQQGDDCSDYKRASSRNSQHSVYNTVRKYNCHNLLNQDSAFTAKSSQNQEEEPEQPQCLPDKPDLSVIEQQQSVVSSSLPIRQRVGHLLPQYMAASYTLEHIKLIQSQTKLDELLDYLRLHRQKTKGQYLSCIKRVMQHTCFEVDHLRQILFLASDFYICTQKKDDQSRHDILVCLPQFTQIENRKQQFRKKLYEYLIQNEGFGKNRNARIPLYSFPFMVKEDILKKQSMVDEFKNKNKFHFSRCYSTGRINPFDALKPGNSKQFQELLNAKIRQNEKRILEEKQKQSLAKFGMKELLAVYDELPKIFKKREKSSMFKSSIIQDLDNSLNIKQEIICKILSVLMDKYPEFFKIIPHKNGQILQIQIKIYNQLRLKMEKVMSIELEQVKENDKQQQKNKVEDQKKITQLQKKERNNSCPVVHRGKGKKISELKQAVKKSTKALK